MLLTRGAIDLEENPLTRENSRTFTSHRRPTFDQFADQFQTLPRTENSLERSSPKRAALVIRSSGPFLTRKNSTENVPVAGLVE